MSTTTLESGHFLGRVLKTHRQGELRLAEVALAAGFADQSHFTRSFKRFTGVTPGQYRTLLAFKTT